MCTNPELFSLSFSPLLDCIACVMRLFRSISALHTHQNQHFCSDIWAFVPVLMWLQMKWRMRREETEVLYGHPSIPRNLQWASLWAAIFFVSLLGWLDTAYMVTGCLPLIFPSPSPALLLFSISSYLLNSLNTPFPSLSPPLQVFLSSSSLSLSLSLSLVCFSWSPSMYSCGKAYWSCVLKIARHTLRCRLIFRMLGLALAHLSAGCQLPLNVPASLRNTHSTFSPFRLLTLYRMQQNAAKNERPTSLKTPSDDANQMELNKADV